MGVRIDQSGRVILVTGACGALGSAVCSAFTEAGATTVGTDIVDIEDDDSMLDPSAVDTSIQADFTDETAVKTVIEDVISEYGRLDALCNIAGTWMGGSPLSETDVETFDALIDINLKTMFLGSKAALPHLQQSAGAIVSVSARSSLSGGTGDGPYRAAKAGVRLLTETIAEENRGEVRANAIMPSVIDTPMNREMMPNADHDAWVDPAEIAAVVVWLCSDGASVTSGAAIPVYGEAI